MGRICNKCLSPIEEGGNFCTQCGSNDIRDDVATIAKPIEAAPVPVVPIIGSQEIVTPEVTPTTEPTHSSFGDLPDFMGGNSDPAPVSQPMPTTPTTSQSILPTPTTPNVPPVADVQLPEQSLFGEEEKKEKKNNKIVFIILGIVGLILLVAGAIVLLTSGDKKVNPSNTQTERPNEVIKKNGDSIRVGNDDYGYVSIPKNWIKFIDVSGTDTLQYTDNGTWIITLYSVPNTVKDAKGWSEYVYDKLKSDGATNVSTTNTKVGSFNAIKVTGYYKDDNVYLTTWFFEDNNDVTHYLALEGPEESGETYDIIKTFDTKE